MENKEIKCDTCGSDVDIELINEFDGRKTVEFKCRRKNCPRHTHKRQTVI